MTWRQRAQRLRAVPLTAVLRWSGAQPDRADPHKWHTAQGVLSVTRTKFINWHLGWGGGGAIDLVMHLHGLGFGQALEWLERQGASVMIAALSSSERPPLRLPHPDPAHLTQVRRYLIEQRRLPAALLDPLIDTGTLYADARANAVFLLLGRDAEPVGAELRGTGPTSWRGMARVPARISAALPSRRGICKPASCASPPSMPSVVTPCIPPIAASPPPAHGPIRPGCPTWSRRAGLSTAALTATPPAKRWPLP